MQSKIIRGVFCAVLVAALFLSVLSSGVLPELVTSAAVSESKKTYDIAVAYDNSGSMYMTFDGDDGKTWSRAKYAMEIFASMLDYAGGDKLTIFPMGPVTVDGSRPEKGGVMRVDIRSISDIDKITDMYSPEDYSTAYSCVSDAYEYLQTSNADVRLLLVLTDGEFNVEKYDESKTKIDIQSRLDKLAGNGIKIQYLSFGAAVPVKGNKDKDFNAKDSSEKTLQADLISICNDVFQRSVLPASRLNGTTLNLTDLSMRKLIVFAQGADAKIVSLTNEKGETITGTVASSKPRTYSDVHCGFVKTSPDTSLSGHVVTFDACPAGTYTLNVTGASADKIQIFYDPDVDIKLTFKDADSGMAPEYSDGNAIYPGEYVVEYALVDRVTGKPVPSELMGSVVWDATLEKTDENGNVISSLPLESGKPFTLQDGEKVYFSVDGTYLDKYKVSTDSNRGQFTFEIGYPPNTLILDPQLLQSDYVMGSQDSWQPIRVNLHISGTPLTDAELESTVLNLSCDPALDFRIEKLPGQSAFHLYPAQKSDGSYTSPVAGTYNLSLNAEVETVKGQALTASGTIPITISYPEEEKLTVDINIQQSHDWYQTTDPDSWQPIRVELALDGKPLSRDEMERLEIVLKDENTAKYRMEKLFDESAVLFYVGQNEFGEYVEPASGDHEFTVTANLVDQFGRELGPVEEDDEYEVQAYGPFFRLIVASIILLIILLILLFIFSRKAYPWKVDVDASDDGSTYEVRHRRMTPVPLYGSMSRGRLNLRCRNTDNTQNCNVSFATERKDRLWTFFHRGFWITKVISAGANVVKIEVGSATLVKDARSGKWIIQGEPETPIRIPISASRSVEIEVETRSCRAKAVYRVRKY